MKLGIRIFVRYVDLSAGCPKGHLIEHHIRKRRGKTSFASRVAPNSEKQIMALFFVIFAVIFVLVASTIVTNFLRMSRLSNTVFHTIETALQNAQSDQNLKCEHCGGAATRGEKCPNCGADAA